MSRKTSSILVQDVPVTVMSIDQRDYISLTDMAKRGRMQGGQRMSLKTG